MAAALNMADGKETAKRTSTLTRAILVFNIVGPIAVGGLMAWGALDVAASRALVEQAASQLTKKTDELRTAQQLLDDAETRKAELEAANASLDASNRAMEKNNTQLLAQKESLEQSIKELLETKKVILDPDAEVERVRRQVGGKTALMRADAFYKAGRDAYARGDMQLAERFYEESRKEVEDYGPTRIGFGRLQADRGNYLEAEAQYLRAATVDPSNPHATFNVAFVNMLLKRYPKAEEYLSKTLVIDPEYKERVEELRKEMARREAADKRTP